MEHSPSLPAPFAEAKEFVGGYAIIQPTSKQAAIDWTKRFLTVAGDGGSEDRLSHEVPTFAASQAGRRSSGATRREQKRRAVLANFPCADGLNDAVIGSGDYRRDTSRD
ncbi:MAG TPA: hypothetical protein VNV41_15120 [Candidatus Acidoferrales bacterium]|jgi:hypothetical protein|nr:hypothetical protein [Candidatus Acidoferrales bacterium]